MKKLAALLLAAPGVAMAANYATCLLDNLPGTANQATHAAIVDRKSVV